MIYQHDTGNPRNLPHFDQSLIWSAIFLLSLGLVMVYSASISIAEAGRSTNGYPAYFLVRHGAYLAAGLVAGLIAFQIPMRLWQKYAFHLFLLGVLLLVLVLVPGIGREVNGSRRWISLLVVNFQPSEFMKLFMVIYVANYTVRKAAYLGNFRKGFLPMLIVMLMVGLLLLLEPDFGSFVVITAIMMAILFLGGINLKLFTGLIGFVVMGLLTLIWVEPYRMQRFFGFLDPWDDPYGKGYQLSHALIAFGRGEWLGVGLGGSVEKLFYLPEAHTDFLLAVIAEELGFAGVATVVALFACLIIRAFVIGRQAALRERFFPALLAQGIGVWLGVQAFINMGVNMGVLPTKGLTLPLMSFGGSSIVVSCLALALLLRVDWENRQLMKGYVV
ncbi:putative lipid II flippase FtsW [Nitrosovibrio tenuis]|uniref:Probable peptidoglycan glycosyltransferase FtsW n=1 Tax=Nitrosovibrio tenuis TaxID=1233 RepID=A0A1H7G451_9PROT|nr:putative lipid II flippase FtsW [Nitrosovibrio tenuis]SEK31572.1 cell division-specific peptidoglycan biosynthesis regulator FtsW [Nitrosovibrio tenuis]